MHGFAQNPASWDEVIALLPAGQSVIVPTLPGHGGAAVAETQASVEATRELLEAAVRLAPSPVVLWGYSLGARAAIDLLLSDPNCVSAAIIESGVPGIEDPLLRADHRSRDEALSRRLEGSSIEEFVAFWERIPALGDQTLDVIEKQRPVRLSHDPAGLAAALRGIGQAAYTPSWDRLGELELPVLLISGSDDPVYRAHAERMAGLIPNARSVVIDGAGHAVHIAKPQAATAAALEFIDSL